MAQCPPSWGRDSPKLNRHNCKETCLDISQTLDWPVTAEWQTVICFATTSLTLTNMHFASQSVFLCVSCNSDYKHQLITSLSKYSRYLCNADAMYFLWGMKWIFSLFSFLKRTNGILMSSSFVGSFVSNFKQLAPFSQIFLQKYIQCRIFKRSKF